MSLKRRLRNSSPFLKKFEPKKMPLSQLPTWTDTIKHYLWLYDPNMESIENTKYSVIDKVIQVWTSASLPYFDRESIFKKFDKYYHSVMKIKDMEGEKYFDDAVEEHFKQYDILFDICRCECEYNTRSCRCTKEDRIPPVEKPFMEDQRNKRVQYIDITSKVATSVQSRIRIKTTNDALFKPKDNLNSTQDTITIE